MMDSKQKENDVLQQLATGGHLLSPQRQIIVRFLCEHHLLYSVEELWFKIRQEHVVSWATVHKTISLLVQFGCVIRVNPTGRQRYYVLADTENTDCI